MALSGADGPLSASGCSSEDPNKRIRKPYTISKSRESWTDPEHDRFLEALQLFDRDWKKIEAYVGSKTVIQIRSHAQKYFLKVQKKGTNEHLPPPRPKRKAAHPYPQKASKRNVLQISHATRTEASCIFEQVYVPLEDVQPALGNSMATVTASSCVHNSVQPSFAVHLKDDMDPTGALVLNDCCYSSSGSPQTWPTCEMNDQENSALLLPVVPDFAQVYGFLGSVFDSIAIDHSQELKEMDPIDIETVLLLMRNLSVNLNSPDFEAHRNLLSSCAEEMEEEICP